MLRRIYADNFKSLVNSELNLDPLTLLLGPNGSGKSSMMEVLERLGACIMGTASLPRLFPEATLTRWSGRNVQRFELDVERGERRYSYVLEIEHDLEQHKQRIHRERLDLDARPLLSFELGQVQLYRDDHSEGPSFPMDWSRSALSNILPSRDNTHLTWFKERISHCLVLRPEPSHMLGFSEQELPRPDSGLTNFASWYRTLTQEHPGRVHDLFEDLRQILMGFEALRLGDQGGGRRRLELTRSVGAVEARDGDSSRYGFDELSDGERALIVLYTIAHFQLREGATVCIDEPGNFIALEELQPWLMKLEDLLDERHGQAILISHHPSLLDQLATAHGRLFYRTQGGPTRVRDFEYEGSEPLTPSELIARGWHPEP